MPSSRSREVNSSIYVFRADRALAGARRGSSRATRRASCTSPTPSGSSSRTARPSPRTSLPTRAEAEGVNTRAELAAAAAALRDRHQRGAHARRRHDRRPGDRVDRARRRARARRDDPPVRRPPRPHARRRRRRDPARTPSPSTPRSEPARPSGRSVTFARARSSRRIRRRAPSWRSRTHASGPRTKVPHLSYIGDAEIGEDTNVGAGAITANFPHAARRGQGPDDDRPERQDRDPEWLRRPGRGRRRCMDSRGNGDHEGRAPRRPRGRASAPGEQGGVCSPSPERLSSSSRGSRWQRAARPYAEARPLDRARAAEAADGVRRPLAPRPRGADRRAARHRARRGRRSRRSRTTRRTAATTSRSAAPTSSSSRPAAARSTRT